MLDRGVIRRMEALQDEGRPFCVATIVEGRGSMPQVVGATALFTTEGLAAGTVGGGSLEERCASEAAALLAGGDGDRTRLVHWNLHRDAGMPCGGEVSLYFECWRPDLDWTVVVFGAGHVAQMVCRYLADMDCRVVCIDTRPDWLERLPDSPKLTTVRVADYAEGIARVPAGAFVLALTYGMDTDVAILQALAESGVAAPYVGVIGSASKSKVLRRRLSLAGVAEPFVEALACPIGDIEVDNVPPEIALSVVAQLLRVRNEVRCR